MSYDAEMELSDGFGMVGCFLLAGISFVLNR
jgi:hypothetical protein